MGLNRDCDIDAAQRKTVLALLERHLPNTAAWAYGSRAKWTARPQSDLDMVVFASPEQNGQVSHLREAFEESNLPFRVDLFVWDAVPEKFRKQIEAEHVVLVAGRKQGLEHEWREVILGDVIELKRGYDLPQRKRLPGSVPIVSSSGITDHHSEGKVQGPGVVTGRCGTLGRVFFIPDNFWPLNTTLYVRDFKGNDPRFISYFLQELNFFAYSDKAAVPGLNRNHLHQAVVRIPEDVNEQRAIARILGALDDKIELNRRMNETLEAMARALFRSWFVDFDPVRAKMAGCDPNLPKPLADLFPDRLVNSELGAIPEGWEIGCLGDIAVAPRRGVDPTDLHDETPYIGLEHMPRRSVALTDWESAEKVVSNKSAFEKGEFLFGKLRPYFHKVGIAPVSGVCSTDIVVIAPKTAGWYAFVLASVSSAAFVTYTNQASTGTKMPRTSWATMSRYPLCLPVESVAWAFQNATRPFLNRIVTNIHEHSALASLRDALLPKLMSGETRLRDTERREEAIV